MRERLKKYYKIIFFHFLQKFDRPEEGALQNGENSENEEV
jgi:hypothetical protein